MKALCINSSTNMAEISIINENACITQFVSGPHSEKLMVVIEEMLTSQKLQVNDLDNLCVVVGPGSFTGIRIAVALIKGMSVVNKTANLISVNSFDLVAYNVKQNDKFLVVLDSGNEDRYVAIYDNLNCKKIVAMNDNSINEFASKNNYKVYIDQTQKEIFTELNCNYIDVKQNTFTQICKQKYQNGQLVKLNQIAPIYVKKSQAERTRAQKIINELKIERVTNYEQLMEIENSCFPNSAWSENIFKEELMQNNKFYYVAKYENKNIAYIGFEVFGDDMNIQKVATLEDFRNCGIATKLVEFVLDEKQKLNKNKIFLEVNVNNSSAINLYEKMGFEIISRRERYYKNGDDCYVMLKQ